MEGKDLADLAELDEPPESVIQAAAFYHCKKMDRLVVGTPAHFAKMRDAIDNMVRDAGLSLFGSSVERYSDEEQHGFTYLAWIGESAIDIHTWPEYGSVIANTHLCNIHANNDPKVAVFFSLVQKFFHSKKPVLGAPVRLHLHQA